MKWTSREVVRERLRLLKERDHRQTATLREAIQESLTQLKTGKCQDYTDAIDIIEFNQS